jgi:hypothetical protein
MSRKKRSRKEFELYLRKILEQDYPKIKYQNPDSWYRMSLKTNKAN